MSGASAKVFHPEPCCLQAGGTTIGGLFAARARIDAGVVATVEGDRRLTFAELNGRVNRLAQVLAREGIRRGDRVGILARNCTAWLELELAAAKLGAIVAAQNWRLAPPELLHCIRLAEPRAMLVAEDYAATLAGLDVAIPLTISTRPTTRAVRPSRRASDALAGEGAGSDLVWVTARRLAWTVA